MSILAIGLVIAACFLLVAKIFGDEVATFILNVIVSAVMAGICWFIAGIAGSQANAPLFAGMFLGWLVFFYATRGMLKSR